MRCSWKRKAMPWLTLILLSLGLSLDDFGLAFSLSLLMLSATFKRQVFNAVKMSFAFSISTALLPLIGWLVGLAIYEYVAFFSAWIVLIVFCTVGLWIIRETFEDEEHKWSEESIPSFWTLLAMGTLGSLDEGTVGLVYPFLEIPIIWIIICVIFVNSALVYLAMLLSRLIRNFSTMLSSILSGIILILLGILKFLEMIFGI